MNEKIRWPDWRLLTIIALAIALGIVLSIYLVGSAAPSDQSRPQVAYLDMGSGSTGVYLAVWTDRRDGGNDIAGAIISPRSPSVSTNFPLTVANASQAAVALAANATNQEFLAVWQDQRNGPSRDIYGQRVQHDGKLVGTNFVVSNASDDQTDVATAYGETQQRYLVVWQDYRNTSTTLTDIYGQFVGHSGNLIGKDLVISNHKSNSYEPSVAYNSSEDEFLVVWEDDRATTAGNFDIYAQRVSANRKLIGSEFAVSIAPGAQSHPEVGYNAPSKTYLVVWQDRRNFSVSERDVYGQLVKNTGALVGGNFAISTAPKFQGGQLSVAAETQGFLVTFDDTRNLSTTGGDVYAQRVSAAAGLQGNNFAVTDRKMAQSWNSVAHAGKDSSYLVVWQDWRNMNTTGLDIYGQHLAIDGVLLETKSDENFLISVPAVSGKLKP
jgi:hypothetical protein